MVLPTKSSQGLLNQSHSLSVPDRQIITGAKSANSLKKWSPHSADASIGLCIVFVRVSKVPAAQLRKLAFRSVANSDRLSADSFSVGRRSLRVGFRPLIDRRP